MILLVSIRVVFSLLMGHLGEGPAEFCSKYMSLDQFLSKASTQINTCSLMCGLYIYKKLRFHYGIGVILQGVHNDCVVKSPVPSP